MSGNNGAGKKSTDSGCHRIVVKLGTSLLTGGSDHLDRAVMSRLVEQVARLHKQGVEIIVVSSGAMAAGQHRLNLTRKTKDIPFKQILCSVGQSHLIQTPSPADTAVFLLDNGYPVVFHKGHQDIPIRQLLY